VKCCSLLILPYSARFSFHGPTSTNKFDNTRFFSWPVFLPFLPQPSAASRIRTWGYTTTMPAWTKERAEDLARVFFDATKPHSPEFKDEIVQEMASRGHHDVGWDMLR